MNDTTLPFDCDSSKSRYALKTDTAEAPSGPDWSRWAATVALFVGALTTSALANWRQESPEVAGQLHVVSLKDQDQPQRIDVRVGDILQVEYDFAIIPQEDISYLDVEVETGEDEDPLSEMGVVFVPLRSPDGEAVIGAGRIAAFLRADAVGRVMATIRPRTSPREPFQLNVRVRDQERFD